MVLLGPSELMHSLWLTNEESIMETHSNFLVILDFAGHFLQDIGRPYMKRTGILFHLSSSKFRSWWCKIWQSGQDVIRHGHANCHPIMQWGNTGNIGTWFHHEDNIPWEYVIHYWPSICGKYTISVLLTQTNLEMCGYILSTVAADALVLKH